MSEKICLNKEEVSKCLEFGLGFVDSSLKKSDFDFGNNSIPRDTADRIADSALGKVGELAFSKFCEERGLDIELDFQLEQGRHNTDLGQDILSIDVDGNKKVLLPLVDIKTTKSYGSWLLLENHKFWASIIILMSADVPGDIESNLNAFSRPIECEFRGYAFFADFFDVEGAPWFEFKGDSRLLSLNAVLWMRKMARTASGPYGLIAKKSQLTDHYKQCKRDFGEKLFIGGKLKCPKQVGLPLPLLRNSDEDIDFLLGLLRETSVPAEEHCTSVTLAAMNLTKAVSRLNRSLL